MNALVTKSGELGLEALLPERNASAAHRVDEYDPPPMLPRVGIWQDADFSLTNVVPLEGQSDLRAWTLQLLHRYRFVIGMFILVNCAWVSRIFSGSTPSRFVKLDAVYQAERQFKNLDKDFGKYQLLCINDDIYQAPEKVDAIFRKWMHAKWSTPAAWEV